MPILLKASLLDFIKQLCYCFQMKKTLVFAYPGTGKTYITQKYKNAIEIIFCSEVFKYDPFKGHIDVNPPSNINVVMTPLFGCDVRLFFKKQIFFPDIDIVLSYPTMECYDEYMMRYHRRGSSYKFIDDRKLDFFSTIKAAEKFDSFPHKKARLNPGQFLESALIDNGIVLIPKGIETA